MCAVFRRECVCGCVFLGFGGFVRVSVGGDKEGCGRGGELFFFSPRRGQCVRFDCIAFPPPLIFNGTDEDRVGWFVCRWSVHEVWQQRYARWDMQHRTGSENGEMATRRPGGLPPAVSDECI